jgi:hypothetical protein
MISTRGLSPLAALALIDRQGDRFAQAVRSEPQAKREIAAFRDRIGRIASVEDLVKDRAVYSFVMKAFGLEREMPAKAMMKRILTSDPGDKASLVNRLTDPRYREINKVMGFTPDGRTGGADLGAPGWINAMVDRYVTQRMIDGQKAENPAVGLALDFERKAKGLTSWYKVLADPQMASFIRTAFGLPDSVAQGDIDGQVRMLEGRMKIGELQDPKVRKTLVRQYAAIAGVVEQPATASSLASLFARPQDWASWKPVTPDLSATAGQAYKLWR